MRTELLYTTRSKIAEIRANLEPRQANAAEKTGKRGAAIVIFALLLRSRAMRFVGQKRRVVSFRVLRFFFMTVFRLTAGRQGHDRRRKQALASGRDPEDAR